MFFSKIKILVERVKHLTFLLRKILLLIFYLILFFDIFIYQNISSVFSLSLIAVWLYFIYSLEIKINRTLFLGISIYVLTFAFQFIGKMVIVEKGVTWFAIFLSISLVQALLQKQTEDAKEA